MWQVYRMPLWVRAARDCYWRSQHGKLSEVMKGSTPDRFRANNGVWPRFYGVETTAIVAATFPRGGWRAKPLNV